MSQNFECHRQCCTANPCAREGVFGRIFNQVSSIVIPSAAPVPVALESSGPLRNVGFAPGSLRVIVPGTYEITYSLGLTSGYGDADANRAEAAEPRVAANVYAVIVSGVLINGVELPAATTYHDGGLCCYDAITMQGFTIAELPEDTLLTAALWSASDCLSCEGRLTVLTNSQLYIKRIGA